MTQTEPTAKLLKAAQMYVDRGWSVVPVNSGGAYEKGPHYNLVWTGHYIIGQNSKKKPSWKTFQTRQPTAQELQRWFAHTDNAAVALVTGAISGVVVLDFDGEVGRQTLEKLGLEPHVRTGSGGFHVYVRHPGWRVSTTSQDNNEKLRTLYPGMDIRADGGMAVLPPSHNSKGPYKQLRSFNDLCELEEMCPELLEACGMLSKPEVVQAQPREKDTSPAALESNAASLLHNAVRLVRSGQGRNNMGHWLARKLKESGLASDKALRVMEQYTSEVMALTGRGVYSLQEARCSLDSTYSYVPRM
ncbi:bifunctional DNA primase/polymerase [Deinococcus roseus]|uniref:DNA primase/polymerase bifunctional N-terminal domain-containing protein n=1 Tax=Deinococcus roseus TaxID=392414 RepID=A0ABQ2DHM4_9DEIO|nr:bifunctional DNA primase/polymerase [Deinococcus roseus]GGJ55703.1 hypothetical protein GCM10008938_47370 [Deinococcus roseus]